MSKHEPTQHELDSSCYHHKLKLCVVRWYPVPLKHNGVNVSDENGKQIYIKICICKTHNAQLCYAEGKCFWQIGAHYSELAQDATPTLDDYELNDDEAEDIS